MHETIIARQVITDAEAAAKGKKIVAATIRVGELAPLTPDELRATLKTLTGWQVEIKPVDAVVKCACGFKGRPAVLGRGHDFALFVCPECGNVPKVEKGNSIEILRVEY